MKYKISTNVKNFRKLSIGNYKSFIIYNLKDSATIFTYSILIGSNIFQKIVIHK